MNVYTFIYIYIYYIYIYIFIHTYIWPGEVSVVAAGIGSVGSTAESAAPESRMQGQYAGVIFGFRVLGFRV